MFSEEGGTRSAIRSISIPRTDEPIRTCIPEFVILVVPKLRAVPAARYYKIPLPVANPHESYLYRGGGSTSLKSTSVVIPSDVRLVGVIADDGSEY